MDIFKLAEPLGTPVTIAIALALLLYWRAWVHEERAGESQLRFVSNLLINGSFTHLGKLVAHLVPKIFDRVFHPNVIWQFIWRSVFATTIWWIILLTIRNPHPFAWQLGTFSSHRLYNTIFVILMYCVDIVSLWKTHILIKWIIVRYTLAATTKFVFMDLTISYLLPCILYLMLSFTPMSPNYGTGLSDKIRAFVTLSFSGLTITDYLSHQSQNIHLLTVVAPSTLLTSLGTILLFVASGIVMMLEPLRRYTAGLRDVEEHPYTSIATLAGTMIIIGGLLIAGVHWVHWLRT